MSREGEIDELAKRLTSVNATLAHDRRIRDGVRQDLARLDLEITRCEEFREDLLERLKQHGARAGS